MGIESWKFFLIFFFLMKLMSEGVTPKRCIPQRPGLTLRREKKKKGGFYGQNRSRRYLIFKIMLPKNQKNRIKTFNASSPVDS